MLVNIFVGGLSLVQINFISNTTNEFSDKQVHISELKENCSYTNNFFSSKGNADSITIAVDKDNINEFENSILINPLTKGRVELSIGDNSLFDYHAYKLDISDLSLLTISRITNYLSELDSIRYFEPNYKGQFHSTTPNDYSSNTDGQWYVDNIELDKAWDITTGSKSFKIGVIDTGIDNNHPDLMDNVNTTYYCDASFTQTGAFNYEEQHGEYVAGIIGAKGNNNMHTSGVMWDANIVSMRCDGPLAPVYNSLGQPTMYSSHFETIDRFITCLNYAETNNISIVNFSGGWGDVAKGYVPSTTQIQLLQDAVDGYSGLLVVASGNDGKNLDLDDGYDVYPACFANDNIITVGASTSNNIMWSSSNYGAISVDLFAPGENILTTGVNTTNNLYTTVLTSGTSIAAPVVAGVAGLIKSINPVLTPIQIKSIIMNNVDTYSVFSGKCLSGGRLNAYKSVLAAMPTHYLGSESSFSSSLCAGRTQVQKIYASNAGYTFSTYSLFTNMTTTLTSSIGGITLASATGSSNFGLTPANSFNYIFNGAGTYYLSIHNNSSLATTYSVFWEQTHTHSYTNSYVWQNLIQHKAYCNCGNYRSVGHAVVSGSNRCLYCHGLVDTGFIIIDGVNRPQNATNVGHGSYILENGVLVISAYDYNLIINGELSIDELLSLQ